MKTLLATVLLLAISAGCRVNHRASGAVETNATVKVEVTYPQCDHPEWTSDEVIRCIEAASSITAEVKAEGAAELAKALTTPDEKPEAPVGISFTGEEAQ